MIIVYLYLSICLLLLITVYRFKKNSVLIFTLFTWFTYEFTKLDIYPVKAPLSSASTSYLVHSIISILFLVFSYFIVGKKQLLLSILKPNDRRLNIIRFFIFFISIIFFLKWSGGNIFYFFLRRMGNQGAQDIVQENFLFVVMNIWVVYQTIRSIIARNRFLDYVMLAVTLAYLFLFNGSRGFVFYSLIFLFWGLWNSKRVSVRVIVPIMLSFFIFGFSFLGELRSNVNKSKEVNSGIAAYQAQLRDENTFFLWHSNNDALLGYSYLNFVTFAIPRVILGDLKPVMLDGLIARRIFGRNDLGMPVHPVTEAYVNFGSFGVIIFILMGVALRLIDNSQVRQENLIYVFLVFISSTLFSTYIIYALQVYVVHILFSLFSRLAWK